MNKLYNTQSEIAINVIIETDRNVKVDNLVLRNLVGS